MLLFDGDPTRRAMLTKLVAPNEPVSEDPTVFQSTFEHKHKHEEMPEHCDANELSVTSCL